MAIARAYNELFEGRRKVRISRSYDYRYRLLDDFLYDYLFENDYEAWLLNEIRALNLTDSRALTEFIMRLHTGESTVRATSNWSWEQRKLLGQRILYNLSEDVLNFCSDDTNNPSSKLLEIIHNMQSLLELDGYIYSDSKLLYSEAAVLDVKEQEGILSNLITHLSLANQSVIKHHLELSEYQYVASNWDDSIANSRKFLEAILQEIAAKHYQSVQGKVMPEDEYTRPARVRDYLQSSGLLEKKEKEAIGIIYSLLSETGGHPYIARKDQARLLRYMALTFAQFVLLRLQGALS